MIRANFAFSAYSTGSVGVSIKSQKGGSFKEARMEEDSDYPGEGIVASPAWRGLDRPPAF